MPSYFISSDTNLWRDFFVIDHLDKPFLLPHTYHMVDYMFVSERACFGGGQTLLDLGLRLVSMSDKELLLMQRYQQENVALSVQDASALALAKERGWLLLTGDRRLREAALREQVPVCGSIWILTELLNQNLIVPERMIEICEAMKAATQKWDRRLPLKELEGIIQKCVGIITSR